ncbi:S10 family peptidase [Sphingomonas hankyongi]|uniref:Peptidase S10 n=1 Tax=Sphingomonas hankyongi TaxID=2908209 RepID=A0ABT0RYS5_9SPHN|nr:peptidase S10 [Sphingomonas hankyongi]MCL6728716.1 peptidase S10 [Sphingomonas hankyongi]
MNAAILAALAAQAATAQPVAEKPVKPEAAVSVPASPSKADKPKADAEPAKPFFVPTEVRSTGSVTVGGRRIAYRAVAGTLVVHSKGWEDTDAIEAAASSKGGDEDEDKPKAEASMFYAAYFREGAPAVDRPITFLFNGGPGSSTVWLHMGAFGPQRVQTLDERHTSAPYQLINNDQSLLDASDLVFIDAPGTGFSRIAGKDKEKGFYGVDQDIDAFTQFITQFLSKYGRWSSPKYVFGESYGTMRGAGLALSLQDKDVDLSGLILLSDILNWDLMPDDPQLNPGVDLPYVVSLPTYAATAWYHNRIARPAGDLQSFLGQVEAFATTDYAQALMKGNELTSAERDRIAGQLSAYTGLPVAYLLKTNLRIEYGAFQKELLSEQATTVGTLDTRFLGATIDPLSKVASYDPQSAAISAAYVAAYNGYVRDRLRYGEGIEFKSGISVYEDWDYKHEPPGAGDPLIALPNVLTDLAVAMKQNPDLKVMVNGGYYDVSTPYFAGKYEMRHLPVPANLLNNIEYRYYEAGHMVYAHHPSLVALHDNVADFIRRTSGAH